jgi:hypothetical protein
MKPKYFPSDKLEGLTSERNEGIRTVFKIVKVKLYGCSRICLRFATATSLQSCGNQSKLMELSSRVAVALKNHGKTTSSATASTGVE